MSFQRRGESHLGARMLAFRRRRGRDSDGVQMGGSCCLDPLCLADDVAASPH